MNKTELVAALESLGMRPGKILGQNFLMDANLLDFIVRCATPEPGEIILEAGPGFGALTRPMLETGAEVYAIEFDRRLCDYLKNNVKEPNFHLIEGDACRVNIPRELPEGVPYRAIANLPYSISSIFIARLIDLPQPPTHMVFMLQKEMGQRLAAEVGTKNYGALSVRVQLSYEVNLLRIVPPQVFFPAPEVESALVEFKLRDNLESSDKRRRLAGIVKTVFNHRRKKIFKPLAASYGADKVRAALEELDISEGIRPDKITVEQYSRLAELI